MSDKFYKPKVKHTQSEAQSDKRKKLFFDKRVKNIVECSSCFSPITVSEAKRNNGLCDECAANH